MIERRALLGGACACAALAACGGRGPGTDTTDAPDTARDTGGRDTENDTGRDTAPRACEDTGASVEGWIEVPLADWPDLATVGGYAYVEVPEALLLLVVARRPATCAASPWCDGESPSGSSGRGFPLPVSVERRQAVRASAADARLG